MKPMPQKQRLYAGGLALRSQGILRQGEEAQGSMATHVTERR